MDKVKNTLVLQSRIEILVTVPGLGHGVPVCGFHTRPNNLVENVRRDSVKTFTREVITVR